MSQPNANPRASAWLGAEWWAALIVIVGGGIIAVAIAAYFTFRTPPENPAVEQAATRAIRNAIVVRAAEIVCQQAITAAKAYGIVPAYATLASKLPTATKVTGRYVCTSATEVARYNIAVDLVCRQIRDARCVSLYTISKPDGTLLYQRRS